MTTPTRADVEALARETFPHSDLAFILELLDEYGIESYERERERVQQAILKLSKGDEGRLLDYLQTAKIDYRDVLYWSEGE